MDRRNGRETFYRIVHAEVVDVLRATERVLALADTRIELCPNYEPGTGTP